MKLKKNPFALKKLPFNLLLILLTLGASLILGFLSFSGMFALMPVLAYAFAAFALSVAYEGEIYLQNIKGALKKLLKQDYLKNYLAKEYLLAHFPDNVDAPETPKFFRDYLALLKLLHKFSHKNLDEASKERKKAIETKLKDMEKWFAEVLFSYRKDSSLDTRYKESLLKWLESQNNREEWQNELNNRQTTFSRALLFSLLAGAFMGLGTTYLIVEAFTVIPFFAAIPFAYWPMIIVPMACIAGGAYAMLTYNSMTDLINNNTIIRWYNKLRDDLAQGITLRNVFLTCSALFLSGLAIALTICTAGTWWTIATNARPLFEWMKQMPSFIMGIINPIITGLSAIFFNLQNTAESLDIVDEVLKNEKGIFTQIEESFNSIYQHLRDNESWMQRINPFRIILKLTILPLRILFFIGHLISIAVTADRMPGVPEIVSALVAFVSEGFEDAHYFMGHQHAHGHGKKALLKERLDQTHSHNHDMDIPTLIIKTVAYPLYYVAARWDWLFSQWNESTKVLSFAEALNKQQGIAEEQEVKLKDDVSKQPSLDWQREHQLYLIERHKTKHLRNVFFGEAIAKHKAYELGKLKYNIAISEIGAANSSINDAIKNPVFHEHRMFAETKATKTVEFLQGLSKRVA